MTFELFAPEPALERLEIPDAEVCFVRQIDLPRPADDLLRELIETKLKPTRLQLPSGCLLLMKGQTQRHWKHGIDKQATPCGPRLNMTFRSVASL